MAKLLLIILWKEKRKNHVKNDGHCCFSILYFLSSSSFVWMCGWVCVCVCEENSAFVQHFTVFLFVDITFAYIAQYLRVFHVTPASAKNLWKSSSSNRFPLKMVMVCKWINFFLPIWIIMQVTPWKKIHTTIFLTLFTNWIMVNCVRLKQKQLSLY